MTDKYNTGTMYLNGKGVKQDDMKAFEYYQLSAAQAKVI